MNNKELSQEKIAALQAAKNEAPFSAQNLLEDIIPLIKSYFISTPVLEGDAITVTFLNGQKFKIYAEAV